MAAQAVAARRAGKPIPPSIAQRLVADRATRIDRTGGSGRLVPLTDHSSAFAFLIIIDQAPARHRWWLTYEKAQSDGEETWRRIERRMIAP
jgi:hypothetical protein